MKKALLIGTILATSLFFAQQAHAQCGSGFGISICGQIYVNTPVVNPPQVVVQPPVVVQNPPPVYTPPPVVYTPPPQPVVVHQQPTPVLIRTHRVITPAPRLPRLRMPRPQFLRDRGFGFGVRAGVGLGARDGDFIDDDESSVFANYGGGAVIRYIASPRFGVEVTADVYGGSGHTGDVDRVEIPVTVNALWFINPRNRIQLYLLGGLGVSFASIEAPNGDVSEPIYGGGELGLGVEFLLGHHIGLTLDVRGFLRGRMTDRELDPSSPAHDGSCRPDGDGWECTPLEGGATINAGFNFYL